MSIQKNVWQVDYSCGTLDAQQGSDGGVVLLVTGTITTHPGEAKELVQTFVQTFYLAPSLTTAKSGWNYSMLFLEDSASWNSLRIASLYRQRVTTS